MSPSDDDIPREYASSPCYQREFDHASCADLHEIAARLNELVEGERAGAKGLIDMRDGVSGELAQVLDAVARDEARFCAMLGHHLTRLGYVPSRNVGVFYEKLAKRTTLDDKLRLLDRGQAAVVRVLDELLPSIRDSALYRDLEEMRATHVRNIAACAAFLDG